MKNKILTTVLFLVISCAVALAQSNTTSTDKQSSSIKTEVAKDSVYYNCSMHHDVKMDKPGKCPKCGMALEKKTMKMTGTKNEKQEAMKAYTCSMHSEVKSDKPGKCPKCGMDLIEKK
jgi:hypothetical protein